MLLYLTKWYKKSIIDLMTQCPRLINDCCCFIGWLQKDKWNWSIWENSKQDLNTENLNEITAFGKFCFKLLKYYDNNFLLTPGYVSLRLSQNFWWIVFISMIVCYCCYPLTFYFVSGDIHEYYLYCILNFTVMYYVT